VRRAIPAATPTRRFSKPRPRSSAQSGLVALRVPMIVIRTVMPERAGAVNVPTMHVPSEVFEFDLFVLCCC
jgi:hypothetical protein